MLFKDCCRPKNPLKWHNLLSKRKKTRKVFRGILHPSNQVAPIKRIRGNLREWLIATNYHSSRDDKSLKGELRRKIDDNDQVSLSLSVEVFSWLINKILTTTTTLLSSTCSLKSSSSCCMLQAFFFEWRYLPLLLWMNNIFSRTSLAWTWKLGKKKKLRFTISVATLHHHCPHPPWKQQDSSEMMSTKSNRNKTTKKSP